MLSRVCSSRDPVTKTENQEQHQSDAKEKAATSGPLYAPSGPQPQKGCGKVRSTCRFLGPKKAEWLVCPYWAKGEAPV